MRLRTGDPTLLDDLRAHFERSGFVVESTGDADLDVRRPDAPSAEQEAREIEMHLKVWRVMRPGVRVELVDAGASVSLAACGGTKRDVAAASRKPSLLLILIASGEKLLEEYGAEGNPSDADFVTDLERILHRARNEVAALEGFPNLPS